MKEMHLQKLVDLVVVIDLSTTLLKMLHLVETCILNLWRKGLLYLTPLHISQKDARSIQATDILF
jgi:hypothetical protein